MVLGLFKPTHPTYCNYILARYPNSKVCWLPKPAKPPARPRRRKSHRSQVVALAVSEAAGPRGRKSDWHSQVGLPLGYPGNSGLQPLCWEKTSKSCTRNQDKHWPWKTQTNIKHHQDSGWLSLLEESRTNIAHPETLKEKQQKVAQNSMLILFHYSTVPSAIQTWPRLHVIDWYHLTRPWRGQS